METFRIYLNPTMRKHKLSPYYFTLLGVIYIVLGFMSSFLDTKFPSSGLVWILGGILFLIGGYYQTNYSSKYFFELNESSILIKQSMYKTQNFSWEKIKTIHIQPIAIEFSLNDNSKEILSLGNVGYSNVIEIKQKLKDYASLKDIELS